VLSKILKFCRQVIERVLNKKVSYCKQIARHYSLVTSIYVVGGHKNFCPTPALQGPISRIRAWTMDIVSIAVLKIWKRSGPPLGMGAWLTP